MAGRRFRQGGQGPSKQTLPLLWNSPAGWPWPSRWPASACSEGLRALPGLWSQRVRAGVSPFDGRRSFQEWCRGGCPRTRAPLYHTCPQHPRQANPETTRTAQPCWRWMSRASHRTLLMGHGVLVRVRTEEMQPVLFQLLSKQSLWWRRGSSGAVLSKRLALLTDAPPCPRGSRPTAGADVCGLSRWMNKRRMKMCLFYNYNTQIPKAQLVF